MLRPNAMSRAGSRGPEQPRRVEMVTGFHRCSEGSVLYRSEGTVVLCAASVDEDVPKWMSDSSTGWVTAEYQMHPRSNPHRREGRDGRGRAPKGRTMEIQRLVARSLRGALDLSALGRRQVFIDCDILEADGGTRTASITAGFVALALALHNAGLTGQGGKVLLRDQVAAISVGFVDDEILVDLDYQEDVAARVDMNVVATASGRLIEVQSTAEGAALPRADFDQMLDAALVAIGKLAELQRQALRDAGVALDKLMAPSKP